MFPSLSNSQVESFVELLQAGQLTPQDQLKVLPTSRDGLGVAKTAALSPMAQALKPRLL